MRRIGLVPAVAALATAAFTGIAVKVGPAPTVPLRSDILNDPSTSLIEPTDRIILVGWWAIAIVLALATSWFLSRRRRTSSHSVEPTVPLWLVCVLGVGSFGVLTTSILWGNDSSGLWPGISTLGLLVGLAFALFTFRMWLSPRWLAVAATLAVVAVVLSYAIPTLLTTPGTVRTPQDFQFTSDEITAVAAGRFPLSNYIPQYSVLLGFPIAPLLHLLGARAIWGVVAWLLLLQIVSFAVLVALPTLVGGWRMIAPAMVVAIVPALSGGPTAYFAAIPMRVVLPSLAILAAFLALRERRPASVRHWRNLLLVGIVTGLATLNNPDFGIPALLCVLVVAVITAETARTKAISTALLLVASLVPFLLYAIAGRISGHTVHWDQWLIFENTFGSEGLNAVAMEPFGLHIAVVTLFMSAAVIGFVLLVKCRFAGSRFGYQQGLLLALTGGWSLLSLAYFSGRSLTPTLVTGYSFMVGMVVAAFLPLLRTTLRSLRANPADASLEPAVGLSLGVLAVAGAASTFLLVSVPSINYATIAAVPPGRLEVLLQQTQAIQEVRDSPAGADLDELVTQGRVEQAVNMSSITSFSAGIPAGSVATNPAYFTISPVFTSAQCDLPWPTGIDHLLVLDETAYWLEQDPSCAAHFDFANKQSYPSADDSFFQYAGDSSFVLLPRATSAEAAG